jgi:hypothetical protein
MKRGSPERSAQTAFIRWARLVLPPGSLVAAIKNEEAPRSSDPMARARFQMARKASGVLVGMPDVVCVLPEGRTDWCEMKAPQNGVISLNQQGVHDRMRSMGHQVIIATSIETARGALQQIGIPLHEAAGQAVAVAKVRVAKPRARLTSDRMPF